MRFATAMCAAAALLGAAAAAAGLGAAALDVGVLELDDHTFPKLVGKQQHAVLVEFVEYSWKTSENYKDVAEAFVDTPDVLVAKLDVSMAKSEALKAIKPADGDFEKPIVRFYAKDGSYETFAGNANEPNELVDFVQTQLSAELKQLKALAGEFLAADAARRTAVIAEAEALNAKLAADSPLADVAKFYVAFMKRIVSKGDEFVANETKRLDGLVDSKSVSATQKKSFKLRRAVLAKFA